MKIPIYPMFGPRNFTIVSMVIAWGQGFAELADATVTLCSFGLLASGFELAYARRLALYMIKRRKS